MTASNSVEITQCKRCGRFFISGQWIEGSIEYIIKKFMKVEQKPADMKIIIKTKLCRVCGLIAAGYYEAVIQCRGMDEEKVKKLINKNKWAVTKVEYKKEGIDIYFFDKKVAESITRPLKKQGFKIIKSHKLVSKRDGRDVYRFYYSVTKNV